MHTDFISFPAGTCLPAVEDRVPAFTFLKENTVDPCHLSDADLARELLCSPVGDSLNCCQRLACMNCSVGRAIDGSKTLLNHKLQIARELWLRRLSAQMRQGPIMNSPQVLRDWLKLYFADLQHEVFVVLYLNAQMALLEAVQHFRGTVDQTSVYPRELVKESLARNASAVLLVHNHPSRLAEPSSADLRLTQTLRTALDLISVRVVDHMVVGGDEIVSFAERGLI
jgi:DNA repair protein RadC